MRIKFVQKFIDKIRRKKKNKACNLSPEKICIKHKLYGNIYIPNYNVDVKINPNEHIIYNKDGQKMRTFFIRDTHIAHDPFDESKYFIWDKFNIGLNTHFYSHNAMLETMGNPDYKYGILIESPAIVPEDYKIFDKHKGLNKDFDLIFTYDTKILEQFDNARFIPFCAKVWNQELINEKSYQNKTKNISILSSNKQMCELHKFRYNLAWKCKKDGLADTFGTFDGGNLVNLADTLNEYRYTICIENNISDYFFSERITTALACGTVPIYIGASKIDEFFNSDGIIKISKDKNIEEVLNQCNENDYQNRLPAIIDNISRAKNYYNIFDYMYEKYLSE